MGLDRRKLYSPALLLWSLTILALLYPVWILAFGPLPGVLFSLAAFSLAGGIGLSRGWRNEAKPLDRRRVTRRVRQAWAFSLLAVPFFPVWVVAFGPALGCLFSLTLALIAGGIQLVTRCHKCGNAVLGIDPSGIAAGPPLQVPRTCPYCRHDFE